MNEDKRESVVIKNKNQLRKLIPLLAYSDQVKFKKSVIQLNFKKELFAKVDHEILYFLTYFPSLI